MSFVPASDFVTTWTNRFGPRVRKTLSAYQFGNSESEAIVQNSAVYKIAVPEFQAVEQDRDRGAGGALPDLTPLSADTASLSFIDVNRLDSKVIRHRLDDMDLADVSRSGITLAAMESDMVETGRRWIDQRLWAAYRAGVPSGNVTSMSDTAALGISRSTGKVQGGTSNQRSSAFEALYGFLYDLPLALADQNIDPATGRGDTTTTLAAVMAPGTFRFLAEGIRSDNDRIEPIVIEGIDRLGIRSSERWRGRLFDTIDLFVDTDVAFKAASNGDDNSNVMVMQPNVTYDAALRVGAIGYTPPQGTTRKHHFAQELQIWEHAVVPDRAWAMTVNTVA